MARVAETRLAWLKHKCQVFGSGVGISWSFLQSGNLLNTGHLLNLGALLPSYVAVQSC